jgi:hypothetical protein
MESQIPEGSGLGDVSSWRRFDSNILTGKNVNLCYDVATAGSYLDKTVQRQHREFSSWSRDFDQNFTGNVAHRLQSRM